jgi:hypothetical protein
MWPIPWTFKRQFLNKIFGAYRNIVFQLVKTQMFCAITYVLGRCTGIQSSTNYV